MIGTFLLYNFILFGSTFCVYFSERCKYKLDRNIFLFIAFLIVTIPAAIRYNTGYDYPSYVQIIEYHAQGVINQSFTPFWLMLLDVLTFLKLPVEFFFVITSVLIYGILFLSYPKKYGYIIHYMFMALYYLQTFSFIRSSLAVAIILYGLFKFLENRNFLYFVLIILIAGLLVHKSALVFLMIPVVYYFNFDKLILNSKSLLYLFLLIIFIFSDVFIRYILFSPILESLGYSGYAYSPLFTKPPEINSGIGVLIKLFILLLPFFISNKHFYEDFNRLYVILFLSLITLVLSLNMFIFSRLHNVFIIGYFFSAYLYCVANVKYRLIFISIIIFLALILFENSIRTAIKYECANLRISPYVSIFNKNDDVGISWAMCEKMKWENL